jgi:hypothetical protein
MGEYFLRCVRSPAAAAATIEGIRDMQTTAIQVNLGMISLNETEVTKLGVGRHHRRSDHDRGHLWDELQEHA